MEVMTTTQETIFRYLVEIGPVPQESARNFVLDASDEILEQMKEGIRELNDLYLSLQSQDENADPLESDTYVEKENTLEKQMLNIYVTAMAI